MGVDAGEAIAPARASPGRAAMLALIAVAAMPNGLYFSPLFDSVLFMVPRAAAAFFIKGQTATFYLTGVLLWLLTLLLAGIPAAVYERVRGLKQATPGSLLIWLIATLALGIPSFLAAVELLSEPS